MAELLVNQYNGSQEELATRTPYLLGEVRSVTSIDPTCFDIQEDLLPKSCIRLEIEDPYINDLVQRKPNAVSEIHSQEQKLGEAAKRRREAGLWVREAKTVYTDDEGQKKNKSRHQWGDPVSHQKMLEQNGVDSTIAWLSNIPSAQALTILSDPKKWVDILDSDGNLFLMDDITRDWLTVITDAVAIRNRGTVLATILHHYKDNIRNSNGPIRSLSIASGTALPTMGALASLGIPADITLVDFDKTALQNAHNLALEVGFNGKIQTNVMNIMNLKHLKSFKEQLTILNERPQIMDLIGIFEYIGPQTRSNPSEFLKANYEMLEPGGYLIFGQMLKERPNPDFTFGVIGWPYIVMRSPNTIMQLIREADINPQHVSLYFPNDNIYTLGVIEKPKE